MAENNRNPLLASSFITLPLTLGWVSGKQPNPFAIIGDASGAVIAKALGCNADEAQQRALAIVRVMNLLTACDAS